MHSRREDETTDDRRPKKKIEIKTEKKIRGETKKVKTSKRSERRDEERRDLKKWQAAKFYSEKRPFRSTSNNPYCDGIVNCPFLLFFWVWGETGAREIVDEKRETSARK